MSTLDEWFGPKPADPEPKPDRPAFSDMTREEFLVYMADRAGNQRSWRCEDRIKPALTAFCDAFPHLEPRGPSKRRQFYSATRELLEELGETESVEFIWWARDHIRKRAPDLTVKDPRSIIFLVGTWRKRQDEGDGLTWEDLAE